jgi:hypothetical protein
VASFGYQGDGSVRLGGTSHHDMAFTVDMRAAARCHLLAADELARGTRRDVAGYLYGIAAECAVKAMMIEAGLRPSSDSARRDDPFFAHFPDLRTMLRDTQLRRRATPLSHFIGSDTFMSQWSTRMRYSDGKDIEERWITAWAQQAHQAVASIGTSGERRGGSV